VWRVLLVVMACLPGACKDKPAPPSPPPLKPHDASVVDVGIVAADPCEGRAKKLSDRLDTLAREKPGSLPMVMPDVELPSSDDGKPIEGPGAVIIITKSDQVYVFDNHTVAVAALALFDEHINKPTMEAESSGRGAQRPWTLYVWADHRTRASTVTKLVGEIGLNWSARLLVAGDPPRPPTLTPKGQALADELAGKKSDEALVLRAQHLEKAGDPCPGLMKAYSTASLDAGPINELASLAKRVPQAIVDCRCNVTDFDTIEYLMLNIFGAFHPTPRWIPLRKLKSSDKTVDDLARE
jgi:hypothetical protein